jgi:hypothetical protein
MEISKVLAQYPNSTSLLEAEKQAANALKQW